MESKHLFIALALIACVGVYLLGDGITGMITSQSCCFGANCPADQLCREPMQESPMSVVNAAWGGVLIIGVIAILFAVYHTRKH
jgi:hypothetical protein